MTIFNARPLCALVLFATALLLAGPTQAAPRRGEETKEPAVQRPEPSSPGDERGQSLPSKPEPPPPPPPPPPAPPPPPPPPPTPPPDDDPPDRPDRDRVPETRGEPGDSRTGRGREPDNHSDSSDRDHHDRDPYDRDHHDHDPYDRDHKVWVSHDIACCPTSDPDISGMVRVDDPVDLTALDLDVIPRKAFVYVNGALQGKARKFDGFPSYLWLENGTWDLAFYRPGYQTVARRYVVEGDGRIIRIQVFLLKGETILPESLLPEDFERNVYHP